VSTRAELDELRATMCKSAKQTRGKLARALQDHGDQILVHLKLADVGCDPLAPDCPQNFAEQIDQQATHGVALDALEWLMRRFPRKKWCLAAGPTGFGPDITSADKEIGAEVFAAVSPKNNRKLAKDIQKISKFRGPHRFVFYRSRDPKADVLRCVGKKTVRVISFGPPAALNVAK
jgi:hypothetical protein